MRYGLRELQGCNVVYHAVSSPFQVTHPYSPPGPFPSNPPFLGDGSAGANGPIHLSSIRAEPTSPAARCHRAGSRRKRNPIGLRLNLGGLQGGDLVGEEERAREVRALQSFEVAAVTREHWGDRLGRGWSPPCS